MYERGTMFSMQKDWTQCHQLLNLLFDPYLLASSPTDQKYRNYTLGTKSRNPFITPTTPPHSALVEYVNSLKTAQQDDKEILEVLKTCYEEPAEKIAVISTSGAMDF